MTLENPAARTHAVFFYGLYMDEAVLATKGVIAKPVGIAYVEDHEVKLGSKAMMLRSPGARAYGVVFHLTHGDIGKLYAAIAGEYVAEAFTTVMREGGERVAAVSMVHLAPPVGTAEDPAYAGPFKALLRKIGLPG